MSTFTKKVLIGVGIVVAIFIAIAIGSSIADNINSVSHKDRVIDSANNAQLIDSLKVGKKIYK